ncbi:sugar phosphate isomerase/epimerase [Haloferula luteola]|uniref:Sugar phosphate isomerase/epimerase n=1 Tax=Haloferula luteola TaxID=595692 RepID=A0A840UYR4_9BACT|nr:TIM barrel protein [Haloferula luteola]MBB5350922.1 sugar phosphate isomerase/epimerase [Haloferula luteola]
MKSILFKTLWGHEGSFANAISEAKQAGFAGLEGPVPPEEEEGICDEFFSALKAEGCPWIAEVTTCTKPGVYVPEPGRTVKEHLESLDRGVAASLKGAPRFINSMAGYDAWPLEEAIRFFRGVVDLEQKHGIGISVETHRGRSTFSPWATREILLAVPDLKLTCDFSHWCVVAERWILDEHPEILDLAAQHAYHIQARIGYAQGPQVPDPRAPEYAEAYEVHLRWWDRVVECMATRGFDEITLTPEFGPDGYLQCEPFSRKPVADLWELNRWIGHALAERFSQRISGTSDF